MTCDFIKEEKLSAYIDGELSPDEMQEVAKHLKTCEVCSMKLREIEEISEQASIHYEEIAEKIDFSQLMADLNNRIKNLDEINDEHIEFENNIIEFPKKESKQEINLEKEETVLNKIYKFAPAIISLAAIIMISFILFTNNDKAITTPQTADKSENVTVDSLEYSKFNAMIYKVKEKNKTVIWLFNDNSNDEDDDDGPI